MGRAKALKSARRQARLIAALEGGPTKADREADLRAHNAHAGFQAVLVRVPTFSDQELIHTRQLALEVADDHVTDAHMLSAALTLAGACERELKRRGFAEVSTPALAGRVDGPAPPVERQPR